MLARRCAWAPWTTCHNMNSGAMFIIIWQLNLVVLLIVVDCIRIRMNSGVLFIIIGQLNIVVLLIVVMELSLEVTIYLWSCYDVGTRIKVH